MAKKIKVLIFPAGEINSIELHDALSTNVNIEVMGASSLDRHGAYVFKKYFSGLPFISDSNFLDNFNDLLKRENVDLVFPTHDTVALFFAENQNKISAKVVTADLKTNRVCRDKRLTYALFQHEDFCPVIYDSIDKALYPCFIKPRMGQGAVGARKLDTAEDTKGGEVVWDDYVISEYLPGSELTVDCLTDYNGKLMTVLPRSRDRIFAGVSAAGTALPVNDEILKIAECINNKLRFLGLWYFQLKQDRFGKYKLMEISTRCAGTMCLSRARGVNLPLLSVYAAIGKSLEVFENMYEVKVDRTMISRYKLDYEYSTVYMDYDDTIIVNHQVYTPIIKFMYQCKNLGKRLVLLTRHEVDHNESIYKSLKEFAIPESLFERVIEIGRCDEKCNYINPSKAIFIDNAYKERKKVHDRFHIPVFDVDGIEVLLDWRS